MTDNPTGCLLRRGLRWAIAWIAGCIVYFFGMLVSPYAGFETLICQPFMMVCTSGVFVVFATVAGLPLAFPRIQKFWSHAVYLNLVLLIVSLGLLFISQTLGWTTILSYPETNQTWVGPHPIPILVGYFLLIFVLVNWPSKAGLL
jgi:hypothetical protein